MGSTKLTTKLATKFQISILEACFEVCFGDGAGAEDADVGVSKLCDGAGDAAVHGAAVDEDVGFWQGDRGGFGAIVAAGSVLMALPSSGELVVFAPVDDKFTELARIKVADTPTYAYPVIAGNRIFVKDQDAVTMWMIE